MKNTKKLILVSIFLFSFLFVSKDVFASIAINPLKPNLANKSSWFVYENVKPGSTINDTVSVFNTADNPVTIKVYPVDAIAPKGGGFALKDANESQISVGKWASFNEKIRLAPKETRNLDFTLKIPKNIAPGDYAGGIIAEIIAAESDSNVKIVARIGSRVYLNVSGKMLTKFNWNSFSHFFNGTNHDLKFAVSNEGNTSLIANANVKLENTFGKLINTYEENFSDLLAGDSNSLQMTIPKEDIPFAGLLKATAEVKYSTRSLSSGEETLVGTETKTVTFLIAPPIWLMAVILIILVTILSTLIYHVLLMKKLLKSTISYRVKQGDTIQSVAGIFQVNWKKVAKVNKLKSPYFLTLNQSILIPIPPENLAKLKLRMSAPASTQ